MNCGQKNTGFYSKIEPATQGDLLFGRGESLCGGSEGATWEEVWEVWRRERGCDLGGNPGGLEMGAGKESSKESGRKSGRESGSERGSEADGARPARVTKPEMLTPGKNPYSCFIFGERRHAAIEGDQTANVNTR